MSYDLSRCFLKKYTRYSRKFCNLSQDMQNVARPTTKIKYAQFVVAIMRLSMGDLLRFFGGEALACAPPCRRFANAVRKACGRAPAGISSYRCDVCTKVHDLILSVRYGAKFQRHVRRYGVAKLQEMLLKRSRFATAKRIHHLVLAALGEQVKCAGGIAAVKKIP